MNPARAAMIFSSIQWESLIPKIKNPVNPG
jgi:hypothetical protein